MYSFAFDFVIGKRTSSSFSCRISLLNISLYYCYILPVPVYANSLLASLNSRRSLQRHNYEDRRTSTQFSTVLHVMSSAMETGYRVAQEESLRSVS